MPDMLTGQLLSLALADDDLLHLSDDFDIFNNVRVLSGDENEEEPLHWLIHVSDVVRLDKGALFLRALLN